MSFHYGRYSVSAGDPEPYGICDRCGFMYKRSELVRQQEYQGNQLQTLNIYVCTRTCLDVPAPFMKTIYIPPDPVPVLNPRPITPYGDISGQYTAQTISLIARMQVKPAPAVQDAINSFIEQLIAAGIWSKLDFLYAVGGTTQQTLLNWIGNFYNGTAYGAEDFEPYRGFKGGGVPAAFYIDTGMSPNLNTKYQQHSCMIGGAIQDAVTTGVLDRTIMGSTGTNITTIRPNGPGLNGCSSRLNLNASQVFTAPITEGLWTASRIASSYYTVYKDADPVAIANIEAPPIIWNSNLELMRWGSLLYSNARHSMWWCGAGLTSAEVAQFYAFANEYLVAIGAQ